jgi:DNA-binding beta-propeller fold protein YncE
MRAGNFDNPTGVAVDSTGRLFVVDAGRKRIQVFSAKGKTMKSIGDGALFGEPFGIVIDRADTLYVTDSARNRIVKLDASGKVLATFGENELKTPRGLAVRDGFFYVADSGNARVAKFEANGKFIASAGCRGTNVGEFLEPVAVAIDADKHLYVVDRAAHRVQKLGHQ